MEILTIRSKLHLRLCKIRAIYRVVFSLKFELAFNRADSENKSKVETMISNQDAEELENWLKRQADRTIEELTMRELRSMGQRLGVKNYNNISKGLLIAEVRRLEYARKNNTITSRDARISAPIREDY